MLDGDLVLVHGFWSSAATWDRLGRWVHADPHLRGLGTHPFPYRSPKLSWPFSSTRIPDYDDIAQSLVNYLSERADRGNTAIVTHSQGGLILQRFLAWMLNEGRGPELAHIKLIVMLACPNDGSEYLRSIRKMAGFGRHAQARDLQTLSADVADARRIVLRQIVNARKVGERECPIPVYVYAGDSDAVVLRTSAQGGFPNAGVLPGTHFTIIDPEASGNLTGPTLRRHLLEVLGRQAAAESPQPAAESPQPAAAPDQPRDNERGGAKYTTKIQNSKGIQVGDHGTQHNTFN